MVPRAIINFTYRSRPKQKEGEFVRLESSLKFGSGEDGSGEDASGVRVEVGVFVNKKQTNILGHKHLCVGVCSTF